MTFRHIVLKNLKFNFKRFMSYLFVNSFVVAVLFMYGSLLFNEILAEDIAMQMATIYLQMAAYAIILFCVVFVAYTGIYFVKSRGKEFGVYLTLGMTSRDLLRMIAFESLAVVLGSAVCGIVAGLLFSKLFYLILGKILDLSSDIYFISYKTFLLSLGVFLLVFLCNLLFTSVFIRKLSIIRIAKANSTKGVSRPRPVIGGISVVILLSSIWLFHAAVTGNELVEKFIREQSALKMTAVLMAMIVSLYFSIAFVMNAVKALLARFPAAYNRNILILTNLSHRFYAYKVSLYLISILVGLAVFFMGSGLSQYNYTKKSIDEYIPYDYMIESRGAINPIRPDEIEAVVRENGGELSSFSALEFIDNENYRESDGRLINYRASSMIVSESNFNRHIGLSVDVAPDELLLVYNEKEMVGQPVNFDSILSVEPWREGITRADAFRENPTEPDTFLQSLGDAPTLRYERSKTRSMYAAFINSYGNIEYQTALANVVDDEVYDSLSLDQAQRNTAYLFNLKTGDGHLIFTGLLDVLRAANKADDSLWASAASGYGPKDQTEYVRPIYKGERYEIAFRIGGFLLFSFAFLGSLFLLSSIVVLYYKIVADIDEEKEQMDLLRKIGLTGTEGRAYVQRHLAILFFAPLIIGGLIGLFFVYSSVQFTYYAGYLMMRVCWMYGAFVLVNLLFFLSLRKKFLRGIGLGSV